MVLERARGKDNKQTRQPKNVSLLIPVWDMIPFLIKVLKHSFVQG